MALIDRDIAVDVIKNADVVVFYKGTINAEDAIDMAIRATKASVIDGIEELPIIEPETEEEAYERGYTAGQMAQRKGRWIFVHPLQDNDSGAYMCSVCKTGDFEIKPTDKYCKFCGAKMEEGD